MFWWSFSITGTLKAETSSAVRDKKHQRKLNQHTRWRIRQLMLVCEERNQSWCGGVPEELPSSRGTTSFYLLMHFWDAIRLLLSMEKVWYRFSNSVRTFRGKNILHFPLMLEEPRNLISAVYGLRSQPQIFFPRISICINMQTQTMHQIWLFRSMSAN